MMHLTRLGEVVGKEGVTEAEVDCMRHRLRGLLRGYCSSSEGTENHRRKGGSSIRVFHHNNRLVAAQHLSVHFRES